MSLKYRNASGVETPIAGLNGTSGELVPSDSYVQKGIATVSMPSTSTIDQLFTKHVTFTTPMPDTDYVLNVDECEVSEAEINRVYNKSTTGFDIAVMYNKSRTTVPSYNVTARIPWTAFKLITNEDRALDEQAIADLQTDKQDKTLDTPLTIGITQQTTVEGALGGLNNNQYLKDVYGGYAVGTTNWWKVPNMFIADVDYTFRSNIFLLHDRNGNWIGLLKIGDNGNNERQAVLINIGGTPSAGNEFYFDSATCTLYYSLTWSRMQITQLSGQKIGLVTQASSSSEATGFTRITPINLMTTSSVTSGSTSLITSGGVYDALKTKEIVWNTSKSVTIERSSTSTGSVYKIIANGLWDNQDGAKYYVGIVKDPANSLGNPIITDLAKNGVTASVTSKSASSFTIAFSGFTEEACTTQVVKFV